ncbi:MAG: hypothetical protein FWG88_11060 [Oscillospiraceae bacterium]|nr:hypothetical protein [Oscillospiraceae bacterium]
MDCGANLCLPYVLVSVHAIPEESAVVHPTKADEFGTGVTSVFVHPHLGVGDANSHGVVRVLAALTIAALAKYHAVLGVVCICDNSFAGGLCYKVAYVVIVIAICPTRASFTGESVLNSKCAVNAIRLSRF